MGSFIASLPLADGGEFTQYLYRCRVHDLVNYVDCQSTLYPINSSRMTAACRKFQVFADHFKPYFDVVEILAA